jgi:hypothetical protein
MSLESRLWPWASPYPLVADIAVCSCVSARPIGAGDFTFGLAVLTTPDTMLATVKTATTGVELIRSTDAGCTWQSTGTQFEDRMRLTGSGASTYAWQYGREFLYVLSADGSATRVDVPFPVTGLGVDPTNPDRIRSAERTPGGMQLMESADAGRDWSTVGVVASDSDPQFVVAFSPVNLDHAIALSTSVGSLVTFDGGNQWLASQGFVSQGQPNGREAAIGQDGQTVWLLLQDSVFAPGQMAEPRAIYLSSDGGVNPTVAVTPRRSSPLLVGSIRPPSTSIINEL